MLHRKHGSREFSLPDEIEEAAASLGANRWHTVSKVILPSLMPAMLTGFALAFARAVGEYGSVIFIAGNMPMVSEITPLLIITKLEQYDYAGATAIAVVMLVAIKSAKWDDVDSLNTLLGFEEMTYFAAFVWLAIAGPGAVSLDRLLLRSTGNEDAPK